MDGEEGVAELADHYAMSFAAVQKHIAVLERAGLVTKRRIGRRKVVRTNVEGMPGGARVCWTDTRSSGADRIDRMTDAHQRDHEGDRRDDRDRRPQGPERLTMTLDAEFEASPIASGSSGPIRASWSAGGARRPTPPPSRSTISRPAAASSTT